MKRIWFLLIWFSCTVFALNMATCAEARISYVYPVKIGLANKAVDLIPFNSGELDSTLPGIPSKEVGEYAKELVEWGWQADLPLPLDMSRRYISKNYSAGLESSITIGFNDGGVSGTHTYFDKNKPLWKMMRDILFLEQMKKSIDSWESRYVKGETGNPGEIIFHFTEAYNRGLKIGEQYQKYVAGTGGKHSPVLASIIGAGGTSYFYKLHQADGALEDYVEGKAITLLENGKSMFRNGVRDALDLNAAGAGKFFTTAGIEFIKQNTSKDVALMIETVQNAGMGIQGAVSGGFGVVLGPVALYDGFMSRLINSANEEALGAHLAFHFILAKNHPKLLFNPIIMGTDGVYEINHARITELTEKFPINSALTNYWRTHQTAYEFPNRQDAQAVYNLSTLFQFVQSLDIEMMKKNIAAYVVLEAEKDKYYNDPVRLKLKNLSDRYKTYALLADRIYDEGYDTVGKFDSSRPAGWELDFYYSPASLQAGLYKNSTTDEYIIAFGGTTSTADDYKEIAKVFDAFFDGVYAVSMISNLDAIFDQTKPLLEFLNSDKIKPLVESGKIKALTGHSLGGGLAAYAGLYLNIDTYTFNGAPLPFTEDDIELFKEKGAVTERKNSADEVMGFTFLNKDRVTHISSLDDWLTNLNYFLMAEDRTAGEVALLNALKLVMLVPNTSSLDYLLPGKQVWLPLETGHGIEGIVDALRFEPIVDNSELSAITLSLPKGAVFERQSNTVNAVQGDEVLIYLNKYFLERYNAIPYGLDESYRVGYKKSGSETLFWADAVFDNEKGGIEFSAPVTGAFTLVRLSYTKEIKGMVSTETVDLPAKQNILENSGLSGMPVVSLKKVRIDNNYWTNSNGRVKKAIAEWTLSRALEEDATFRISINGFSTIVTVAANTTSGQFEQFEKMFSYTIFTDQVTAEVSQPSDNIETSQANSILTLRNVTLGASVMADTSGTTANDLVKVVSIRTESPQDNTVQLQEFTKTWSFVQDVSPYSVEVLNSTFANSGPPIINDNKIALSLTPNTSSQVNRIELQLKDSSGDIVKVANSETFWAITKSNHLPTFANGQQTQMVGGVEDTLSLNIETYDADNDDVTLSVADTDGGSVGFNGNELHASFNDDQAVHTIKIRLSDGRGDVIKDITVLRFETDSISRFYSDLGAADLFFDDVAFATLKGVVAGQPDSGNAQQRIFRANDDASWAEALAMVLNAASIAGRIELTDSRTYLKAFPGWATPYYTFAREKGALAFKQNDLSSICPMREEIAMLLVKSLGLDKKMEQFPELPLDFIDNDQFSSSLMNRYGQIARFFGLFMTASQARPTDKVTRGELARVISRIFMMPSAEINVQASVEFGETLNIDLLTNVKALNINENHELVDSGDGLTVQYAINRRIVDPAKVDVSVFEIGTNDILALIDNDGVRDLINKQIEVTFTDRDFDGIQNNQDQWPDDFRYHVDSNDNGIPDVLDNVFGLSNKSVDDTVTLGKYQTGIWEVIEKGGVPCPQTIYVGIDPDTGEKKQFASPCAVPSNWQSYMLDTIAPTITVPSGVHIDSTGYLTRIGTDMVTVDDNVDTGIIPSPDKHALRPGTHTVTWTAVDSAGNDATAVQIVDVIPQVNMAIDGMVEEGNVYVLSVMLNGNPPDYPVTVPYFIDLQSSTADEQDHDLINGELVITQELGLTATKEINIADEDGSEGTEFLDVRLGTPTNAVKGKRDLHRITIVESNIAPEVTIAARQNREVVNRVFQDQGMVTVTCSIRDINTNDTHSYDWLQSDEDLSAPTDLTTAQWQIDPTQLTAGKFYQVKLCVSDGSSDVYKEMLLSVKDRAPALDGAKDTDGDGVADADEGFFDSDGDGISDYLDDRQLPPEFVAVLVGGRETAIETTPGLKVKLGVTAQKAGNLEMLVTTDDIAYFAGVQSADSHDNYNNVGGLFDFIVSDLPMPGFSIPIVLPQTTAIPANAVYRKYDEKSGWKNFVVTGDDTNNVYSAPGELGICPPPEDPSYVAGLREGNYCVKLLIEDGGPNDADGLANGEVSDPGGVAVRQQILPPIGGGGGSTPQTPADDVPTTPEEVETKPVEGSSNSNNYFLLQINKTFDHDVTVDYATRPGTALEGFDYIGKSGTATIKKGETSTVMVVTIVGDNTKEADEDFFLVITNPQGASFPEGVTEIKVKRTIIDDD